jgi:hypothetical protein
MNVRDSVDRVLGPGGPDAGCEGAAVHLARYADGAVAGDDVARAFPDVANHLAACPDCNQDYEGLVDCIRQLGVPTEDTLPPAGH